MINVKINSRGVSFFRDANESTPETSKDADATSS